MNDDNDLEVKEREQLTTNFYRDEFACPCCGADGIDNQFVKALQRLRSAYGRAMIINSGVRCAKRNKEVGGSHFSAHLYGFAADIACTDSTARKELIVLCMRMFRRVGVYKGWIHVDKDPQKPQDVLWVG